MKTKWKTFFLAICYLLLAGAIQLIMGIGLGIVIVFYINRTGELINEKLITEYSMAGLPYLLIASSLFTILLFYMIYNGQRKKLFKEILLKPRLFRYSMLAAGIGVSAWCVNFFIVNSIYKTGMFKKAFEVFENEAAGLYSHHILLLLIVVGIIAPICEEIVFRGVIFQTLDKTFSIPAAIGIQAVLFGIFHLNLIQGFYTALLGIILGYVVYRTQSLGAAIVIHMINNIMAIVMDRLLGEIITWTGCIIIFIIGFVGLGLFMRLMIKRTIVPNKELLENNLTIEV